MIATVCKSCYTVNTAILDRCKWCGSKNIEIKSLSETAVIKQNILGESHRLILIKELRK